MAGEFPGPVVYNPSLYIQKSVGTFSCFQSKVAKTFFHVCLPTTYCYQKGRTKLHIFLQQETFIKNTPCLPPLF